MRRTRWIVFPTILKFQQAVRDAELERRHRKETDPWDAELSQTPPLPKDWERWVNKVGIQENYIFYDYRKGGARYGYCTYCEKEVALKQRPYYSAYTHIIQGVIRTINRPSGHLSLL